jgi:hypothetical protein
MICGRSQTGRIRMRQTALPVLTPIRALRSCAGCNNPNDFPGPPCSVHLSDAGSGSASTDYPMGTVAGTVALSYDLAAVPAQINVYYDGVLLATTGGTLLGVGTLTFDYAPLRSAPHEIRVDVLSGGATFWQINIDCT